MIGSSNKMDGSVGFFARKHLLGLEDLSRGEILHILDTAKSFREVIRRPIKKVPSLTGVTVCNAFFEPSTRTRLSFELAGKRLSGDMINFSASGSSVSKGETLKDTVRNIRAMAVDMIVLRHGAAGAPHYLAQNVDARVINAGDGFHEHPTQGLLDIYTIREHCGRLDGLKIAIIGDIAHSRVARSNIWGLGKFDTEVTVVGPQTLMPMEIERMGVRVCTRLDEGIEGADVIMALRLQLERMESGMIPSLREYAIKYGLTRKVVDEVGRPLIMHPGPINRGVEIDSEVADGADSVILEQVTNGVAVRMAVLFLTWAGAGMESASEASLTV